MKTIYKYEIRSGSNLDLPEGAKFLAFQLQNDEAVAWFEVNPDAIMVSRCFHIVGTGWKFNDGTYLGTVQQGPLVWHLYENLGRDHD